MERLMKWKISRFYGKLRSLRSNWLVIIGINAVIVPPILPTVSRKKETALKAWGTSNHRQEFLSGKCMLTMRGGLAPSATGCGGIS